MAVTIELGATRGACARLDGDDTLRLVAILVDDAAGGWTNRWFTQFAHRYERGHEVRRGWVTIPCWSSEEPSAGAIAREAVSTLYRTVDERRFAGTESPYQSDAYRVAVEPYLESKAAPVLMTALYGDDVAATLGYPPLAIVKSERGPLAQSPLA